MVLLCDFSAGGGSGGGAHEPLPPYTDTPAHGPTPATLTNGEANGDSAMPELKPADSTAPAAAAVAPANGYPVAADGGNGMAAGAAWGGGQQAWAAQAAWGGQQGWGGPQAGASGIAGGTGNQLLQKGSGGGGGGGGTNHICLYIG